jgi:hypothetical protein
MITLSDDCRRRVSSEPRLPLRWRGSGFDLLRPGGAICIGEISRDVKRVFEARGAPAPAPASSLAGAPVSAASSSEATESTLLRASDDSAAGAAAGGGVESSGLDEDAGVAHGESEAGALA